MAKAKAHRALACIFLIYIGIFATEYKYSSKSLIGTNDIPISTSSSSPQRVEGIDVASPSTDRTTVHEKNIKSLFSASINRHITCPRQGDTLIEGKGGHAVLEKIKMGLGRSQKSLQKADIEGNIPRVLCLVYCANSQELSKCQSNIGYMGTKVR